MADLMTVAQQMFFTPPLAWTRWALGLGGEKEAVELGWQGYDAGVQLATATVDRLYRLPLFGQAVAESLASFLRGQ